MYLDVIVMYSQTLKEHVEHLRTIFKILRKNYLYMNKEKYYFAYEEILFLGQRVGGGMIRMDEEKVRAIQEWQAPTKMTELCSFLELVNYYR